MATQINAWEKNPNVIAWKRRKNMRSLSATIIAFIHLKYFCPENKLKKDTYELDGQIYAYETSSK